MIIETRAMMPPKFEAHAVYRVLAERALPYRQKSSQCLLHDIATRERPVLRVRAVLWAVDFFRNDIQFQRLPSGSTAIVQGISNIFGNSLSLARVAEFAG